MRTAVMALCLLVLSACNSAQAPARDHRLTPRLREAVKADDVELARELLAQGADVNDHVKGQPSLLDEVAYARDPKLMRVFLDRNPSQERKNYALLAATFAGEGPAVLELIPALAPSDGLRDAVDDPSAKIVEMLLQSGADIYFVDGGTDRQTVLHIAGGGGASEIVKVLLNHGANINVRDASGWTPLMVASCECGAATPPDTRDAVKVLLDRGADPNLQNNQGRSALMIAAERGNSPAATMLLEHGANARLKDKRGATALSLARKADKDGDHKQVLDMLAAYKR